MKKTLFSLLTLVTFVFALAACGEKNNSSGNNSSLSEDKMLTQQSKGLLSGQHNVEIVLEDFGTIALTLDADIAPVTVTNFIDLVNNGFYNGLTFHRIIDGFMIQGGDPEGTGYGGSDRTIQGEFSSNGIKNELSHTRGVISMARAGYSNDSASSQFFIVHEDSTYLDGDYAAFGWVTSGMEVVDAICETAQVGDNGTVLAKNQPVIKEIRVVE